MTQTPTDAARYSVGDLVERVGGDYTYNGFVVAAFRKADKNGKMVGQIRYVVQNGDGMLFIFNEQSLRERQS